MHDSADGTDAETDRVFHTKIDFTIKYICVHGIYNEGHLQNHNNEIAISADEMRREYK